MDVRSLNLAEVQRLLSVRPDTWWHILAVRASLRVLPFIVEFDRYRAASSKEKAHVYLSTFRAAQIGWATQRFPDFDITSASVIARNGNRIVGRAATTLGAADVARAAYAVMDAAGAVSSNNIDIAKRALQGSYDTAVSALPSASESFVSQVFDDVTKLTDFAKFQSSEVILLATQRLWRGGAPRWARESERQLNLRLGNEGWSFWLGWYQARLKGGTEFNLSNLASERLNHQIAQQDEDWWMQDYVDIDRKLLDLVEIIQSEDKDERKTISELSLSFIEEKDYPVSISDIMDEFSRLRVPIIQKTLRGELSRLASSGRIERVSVGRYGRKSLAGTIDVDKIPAVEKQTKGAIQFEAPKDGIITVRRRGSVESILSDDSARRRHAEVLYFADRIISENGRIDRGGNVSSAILQDIQRLKDSLGEAPESLDPDLLVPRGDGLRRDLIAYERRDDFSNLPPLPDKLLLDLGKLVAAYNNYVSYDPELAMRDEALLGPDARKRLIPPIEGQAVVRAAVELEAAAPEVFDVLNEEAAVAPAVPDGESRQSRRYSEGAKNFARIAIGKAIDYARVGWKVGVTVGATSISGFQAARWVVANEAWLRSYFSENPTMLSIIQRLLELLKNLPLS